ncbi:MAG: type II toxin-antitoxin system Phd/YefM family antitoxin [Dongiaceae bacterium]
MKRKSKKTATLRAKADRKLMQPPRAWSLREAKARFSEVVRLAQERPQRVTSRGRDAAVILSAAEYQRLQNLGRPRRSLVDFLASAPFSGLDLERRFERSRDIKL